MTESRATGALLWLRAALLGSIALLTGVVSHAAADGLLPSAAALVVLGVLAAAAAAWLLRRRVSWLGLVGLAVLGQTGVHLALSVLAGHRGDASAAPPVVLTGGTGWESAMMGGYADAPAAPSLGWTTHLMEHVTAVGPGMVVAHLLGAVALAGWLAVGEGALWALLLMLGAEVASRLWPRGPVLVEPAAAPARAVVPPAAVRLPLLSRGSVCRRGPPLPVC